MNLTKYKEWLLLNGYSSTAYVSPIKVFLEKSGEPTKQKIDQFILSMVNTHKAGTINNYIKALRTYLKFTGVKLETPHLFKTDKKLPNYLSYNELESIISNIPVVFLPRNTVRYTTLLYFMFLTGLRKSSIYSLSRINFNFQDRLLIIYNKKSRLESVKPLSRSLTQKLLIYFNSEAENNNAFNLGAGEIDYVFKKLSAEVGIKLNPHMMRHSFAIYLLDNGIKINDVQDYLDHKSIQTTTVYLNRKIKDKQRSFDEKIK